MNILIQPQKVILRKMLKARMIFDPSFRMNLLWDLQANIITYHTMPYKRSLLNKIPSVSYSIPENWGLYVI